MLFNNFYGKQNTESKFKFYTFQQFLFKQERRNRESRADYEMLL